MTVFKTAADEHVVSVSRIREVDDDVEAGEDAGHDAAGAAAAASGTGETAAGEAG